MVNENTEETKVIEVANDQPAVVTLAAPSSEPEKNIVFLGKDREPPVKFRGVFRADLPDAETQKAGFYHPDAGQIIAHRPTLYKRFVKKGGKPTGDK